MRDHACVDPEVAQGFPSVGGVHDDAVEALSEAVRELLADSGALAAARAGADQARRELTWDASAAQHLELYRELI